MAASVNQVFAQVQRWTATARTVDVADAVLLRRYAQERDQTAFAALVARHGPMVLRRCRRTVGDAQRAEDAFQAVFLILARRASSLKQPDALPAWLYGVARRVALKARCHGQARKVFAASLDAALPDPHPDPLTQLSARELLDIVDDETSRLPKAQRSAVILCCLEGHSREEAARILGWTPGAVKGHLQRGRQRLQSRLARRGIALSAALAVMAVSRGEAVPSLLLRSTVTAALSGGIGSSVASLAHSVLKAMFLGKLACVLTGMLTVALGVSITNTLVYSHVAAHSPADEAPAAEVPSKAPEKPAARVDRFGDPLPEGALLRLGSIRYRAGGVIFHAALSPDGKLLATASQFGISFFDLTTGKSRPLRNSSVAAFSDNNGSLLAFSPDGKQLVNVTKGGNLHFWDVATGKRLLVVGDLPEPPPGEVGFPNIIAARPDTHFSKVWFPPEGKEVVVGTPSLSGRPDNVVLFIEPSTGTIRRRVRVASQFASIADDGKTLVSIDEKRPEAVLYDDTGKELRRVHHGNKIEIATLCQGGKRLITVNDKAEIKIWDVATGKLQRTFAAPRTPWVVSIAPDGKTLFAGTNEGDILRWDLGSGKEGEPLRGHGNIVSGLFYARDGRSLISVGWDNVIRRWKLPSGQSEPSGEGYAGIFRVARSPDGRTIAAASAPGRLEFWDAAAGKRLRAVSLPTEFVSEMRFAPDGKVLALACSDPCVRLWDVDKGRTIREWKLPASRGSGGEGKSWFEGLAWSPDGRLLAASLQSQGIWMWERATGKEIWHVARNGSLAFSPDGKTLVSGGWDLNLTFQNPASGNVQFVISDERKVIHDVAFSPDGNVLATCHQEGSIGTICLRDPVTGRARKSVRTHHFIPFSVSFSADSKWLASSGIDGTVSIWEMSTATEILSRAGHNGWVRQVEFGPDGRTVLSASDDLTALLWSVDPGSERGPKRPLEVLWNDLASEPVKAYRALWEFTDDPRAASDFLRKKIAPVKIDVEERRLRALLDDLDSDDFGKRESAGKALAAMGKAVEGRLRRAMAEANSVEVRLRLRNLLDEMKREPTAEDFRGMRAVQVLELSGTEDALRVLREWAGGTAGAPLTEQAKAALKRLASGAASTRR